MIIYLARDKSFGEDYILTVGRKPKPCHAVGNFIGDAEIREEDFEKATPKKLHLKPGEGPVKISVKIERVK